jgi:hypothetical protein
MPRAGLETRRERHLRVDEAAPSLTRTASDERPRVDTNHE